MKIMKTTDEAIWEAQPFVTCESRNGDFQVVIKCETLKQAQNIHEAIVRNGYERRKSLNVPQDETIQQKLDRLQTGNGGWTKKALAELGIAWPPKKGWRKALLANEKRQ